MATLREIVNGNSDKDLMEIKITRKAFEESCNETAYVQLRYHEGVTTFMYIDNGMEIPLHYNSIIADDWHIINKEKNNIDLEDIIQNFKQKLISVVKDIDDFQYTILNEKNNKKHLTK